MSREAWERAGLSAPGLGALSHGANRKLLRHQNSRLARCHDERGAGVFGRQAVLPGLKARQPSRRVRRRVREGRRPPLQQPLGRALDIADRSAFADPFPDVNGLEMVKHGSAHRARRPVLTGRQLGQRRRAPQDAEEMAG